ncbi:MAG: lipid A export permease/ATP-binding protein MsbA [Gammaproteobacteria bacterium]|nr:MAG: lipid A export permease/ATP-binding protein MsbA [Gammaproteobacteria bacterium]
MGSKKKATNSDLRIYLRLLTYLKPFRPHFIFAILGMVMYAAGSMAFSEIFKSVGRVFQQHTTVDRYEIPLFIIGVTLIRSLGSFIGSYNISLVAQGVIHNLRVQVFNHILNLSKNALDKHNSNHLISLITYNINGVTQSVTDALKIGLRDGIVVIGCTAGLIYKDWKLTMVFLIVAPFIGFIVSKVGKRLRRLNTNAQTSVGDIAQVSSEAFTGINIVRAFGAEDYEKNRFEAASRKNYSQNMKIAITQAANSPIIQLLVAFALSLIIYIGLGVTRMTDALDFFSYLTLIGIMMNPIKNLGTIAPMILKGVAAADSVFGMLDEVQENDKGTYTVDRVKGQIEIRGLSYKYPLQENLALNNVNLSVEPGKVIALVGRSGSGKTTLVNLLPRFYDVHSGNILFDGVDIRDYTLASLRDQVSIVNQQVILFDGTIAENIAYGRAEKVTPEDIKRAADLAYASEFIEKLPQGFDTQVGEGGARLSGGQRQRLAIARAILKDSPILILDEATSALDNESERYIQAALEQVMKGRTTFVIAHRLSTVEHADRIIVMEQGEIVEQGKHKDLIEKNGVYAKLHAAQFHDDMGSLE